MYTFTCGNGGNYTVYFYAPTERYTIPTTLVVNESYIFGFYTDGKKGDAGVKYTIAYIIDDFFKRCSDSTCVYFYCDSEGGKGESRDKLFNRWYGEFHNDVYIKKDINIRVPVPGDEDQYSTIYKSVLYKNVHPCHNDIEVEFETLIDYMYNPRNKDSIEIIP